MNDIMIVVAPRVTGDMTVTGRITMFMRRVIVVRNYDHRASCRKQELWINSFLRIAVHPGHFALKPTVEPFEQFLALAYKRIGTDDPKLAKSEFECFFLNP